MVVLANSFAGEDAGAPAPAKRRSKQSSRSAATFVDVDGSFVFLVAALPRQRIRGDSFVVVQCYQCSLFRGML